MICNCLTFKREFFKNRKFLNLSKLYKWPFNDLKVTEIIMQNEILNHIFRKSNFILRSKSAIFIIFVGWSFTLVGTFFTVKIVIQKFFVYYLCNLSIFIFYVFTEQFNRRTVCGYSHWKRRKFASWWRSEKIEGIKVGFQVDTLMVQPWANHVSTDLQWRFSTNQRPKH